ncbi:MAG: hypothetical protein JO019_04535 [Candidatus Kaiserbacteria bacterium]|nr:hypothetical protein [Candidatus Kaiserbacteria bacterium]
MRLPRREKDRFFVIMLATILVARIFLYIYPLHSPIIGSFHMHHYMYGLALIALGLLFRSLATYSIGWALLIDEIPSLYYFYILKSLENYFAPIILFDLATLIVIVFFLRAYFSRPFTHTKR